MGNMSKCVIMLYMLVLTHINLHAEKFIHQLYGDFLFLIDSTVPSFRLRHIIIYVNILTWSMFYMCLLHICKTNNPAIFLSR